MLPSETRKKIEAALPLLIERGRLGDQNALGLLVEMRGQRGKNERASFAYDTALTYVREHPKDDMGVASIAGDKADESSVESVYERISKTLNSCGALTTAIMIEPWFDLLIPTMFGDDGLVSTYVQSLREARNGNFNNFPTLSWELGIDDNADH